MARDTSELTITSYALLGQLALRSWSVYEMAKNIGRTLHWFWPRAESVIYAEPKRLVELGLARSKAAPGRRGRPQTIYSITPAGRRALRDWLGTPPNGFSFHFEPLLRVHLSAYGTKADLLGALEAASREAEQLLRQAITIGTEFAEGGHQFQHQVHVRAILFDYLWSFGLTMYLWADRWKGQVGGWPDLEPHLQSKKQAVELIQRCLAESPFPAFHDGSPDADPPPRLRRSGDRGGPRPPR